MDWSARRVDPHCRGLALPLYCFHMVLGHSRDAFCRFVGSMDLVTFGDATGRPSPTSEECSVRSSTTAKTVVKDTSDAARDTSANSSIRRLWQARPPLRFFDEVVQGLPTEDQGKVESDVDYVRDTLSGTMMKPASAWARWNEEVARHRTHGTHGETVSERAKRDRAALLALPPEPYLVVSHSARRRSGWILLLRRPSLRPARLRLQAPGERVELVREYGRWRRARYRRASSGRTSARGPNESPKSQRRNGVSGRGALRAAG